jgi:hypothetical protein
MEPEGRPVAHRAEGRTTLSGGHGSARFVLAALTMLLVGSACSGSRAGGGATTGTIPGSPPPPTGPSGGTLPTAALRLAVLTAVGGHLIYCDPDLYPVAQGDAVENARRRLPLIRDDREAFAAILAHEHLSADRRFSTAELIQINEDYKQMQAIDLRPAAEGGYRFEVKVPQRGSDVGVWALEGRITRSGAVTLAERRRSERPICPICLAAGSPISTPLGAIPVQSLRAGMPVWTLDRAGRRIRAVVVRVGHMEAPLGHEVVRITLADGRRFAASPGHPTPDGGIVGDLRRGDPFAGSVVVRAEPMPFAGATWDLLPSGPTGFYLAGGVPLASSLGVPAVDLSGPARAMRARLPARSW